MSAIEALYIFDQHNQLLFNHVYTGSPQSPTVLLSLYLEHASPRPSVIYLPATSPPTVLFALIQDNILLLSPSSIDIEPLLVLEFLHRMVDSLQEFLGSPLLATKLITNFDIVAQVVAEMVDSGIVCQGEANVLRDSVETGPGVLNNLFGKVGLGGAGPTLQAGGSLGSQRPTLATTPSQSSQGSAIPWRRSNVRHTSNELYVDIVESLSVILAPSGRPLSAFAHGSIAFTSKVSGIPDLLLCLSPGAKGSKMGNRGDQLRTVMERVVFHPCVRLNTWKKEGVLSFVPPDGRFALCGYEVDLLGSSTSLADSKANYINLNLPATIEINTGLGTSGLEFEVRVRPDRGAHNVTSMAAASLQSNLSSNRSGGFKAGASGDSKSPALEGLTVRIPIPDAVRNVSEMRPTKGEAHWNPADGTVDWEIPAKDFRPPGVVLRCTVQGPLSDEDADGDTGAIMNGMTAATYDYDQAPVKQSHQHGDVQTKSSAKGATAHTREQKNGQLMPRFARLSFSVKGWLASGLKVESLLLDSKKSRGIGAELKPYKGVKYMTVSREGVEIRC